MSATKLQGLHLLVTRPQAQAKTWAEELRRLGAEVTRVPMLEIVPLTDKAAQQAIKNRMLALDEYQKAIFVSQNAVTWGAQWIDQYWPQLPSALAFFAVGAKTASQLQQALVAIDAGAVTAPDQAMNSEALLALPQLHAVAGEKIIIFRGCGGRTHLAEVLSARGATVDYCELYRRQIPDTIDNERWQQFITSKQQSVISVHSGETLANLCRAAAGDLPWLQQQPLLVPGERVAEQARQQQFNRIIVAENATHDSMTEALYEWRQEQQ